MPEMSTWYTCNEGRMIGAIGPENGVIMMDEEHPLGSRITLEKDGYQPWSITCGVYGSMVHTTFAANEADAHQKYNEMKSDITVFLLRLESDAATEDEALKMTGRWCEEFTHKYF